MFTYSSISTERNIFLFSRTSNFQQDRNARSRGSLTIFTFSIYLNGETLDKGIIIVYFIIILFISFISFVYFIYNCPFFYFSVFSFLSSWLCFLFIPFPFSRLLDTCSIHKRSRKSGYEGWSHANENTSEAGERYHALRLFLFLSAFAPGRLRKINYTPGIDLSFFGHDIPRLCFCWSFFLLSGLS